MIKIDPHMMIMLRANPHYFLFHPEPEGSIPAYEVNRLIPKYHKSGMLEQMAFGWDYPGDHILHVGYNRTMTRKEWLKYYSNYRKHRRELYLPLPYEKS